MSCQTGIGLARSALFVPADRPDRFHKASEAGADLVILDLEDSVIAAHKESARTEMVKWLRGHTAVVRINAVGTEPHDADIEAVRLARPLAVMIPKAEPDGVFATESLLGGVPLIPLIESARGVGLAREIAALPSVRRIALGTLDLAADLGCTPEDSPVATAADLVAIANAASGLPGPLDGVCSQLYEPDSVAVQAQLARRRGYAGKLAIHPAQISVINRCFAPTESEIDWAEAVLATAGQGAVALDGRMVDEPVLRRARHLLALVKE